MADTSTLVRVFLGSASLVRMVILLLGEVAASDLKRWGEGSLLSTVENKPYFMEEEAGRQVSYLPPIPKRCPSVIFVTTLSQPRRAGGVGQW